MDAGIASKLSVWFGRLTQVPLEYALPVLLFSGSMISLLFARSWPTRTRAGETLQVPATGGNPGLIAWSPRGAGFSGIWPIEGDPTARQPGTPFGAFLTVIGLAIVAVGVTAVVRAQLTRQLPLMRPGVLIAASGQFVLLLGLIGLAVHSRRAAKDRRGAHAGSLQTALGPVRYAWAVQPGADATATTGWPAGPPPRAAQPGQIAQLKAQLACLADQLDQLG